jgi:hypothetical protein
MSFFVKASRCLQKICAKFCRTLLFDADYLLLLAVHADTRQ